MSYRILKEVYSWARKAANLSASSGELMLYKTPLKISPVTRFFLLAGYRTDSQRWYLVCSIVLNNSGCTKAIPEKVYFFCLPVLLTIPSWRETSPYYHLSQELEPYDQVNLGQD